MSSVLLHHEPCPHCGSRDNVGVYSDGHKWCFTPCGYYVPPTEPGVQEVWDKIQKKRDKEVGKHVYLPEDFTYFIPPEPRAWIKGYDITEEEITKNRIGWSDAYQGIIYPAFDIYGNLLLYQRRGWPKKDFHTEGRPELVDCILGDKEGIHFGPSDSTTGTVGVVEDYLSAIKVSRHICALPLWGSSLNPSRAGRLARRFSSLVIWLDLDKRAAAAKYKARYQPFYDEVKVVITEKDPKDYDDASIRTFLGLAIQDSKESIR